MLCSFHAGGSSSDVVQYGLEELMPLSKTKDRERKRKKRAISNLNKALSPSERLTFVQPDDITIIVRPITPVPKPAKRWGHR